MLRTNGFSPKARRIKVPEVVQQQARATAGGRTNEVGFSICRVRATGKLTNGPVATGTPMRVDIPVECPPDARFEGLYHTHPGGVAMPSAMDVRSAKQVGARVLCIQVPETGEMACYTVRGVRPRR